MQKFENWPDFYPDPSWFIHDRFGLFIHFGLFSVGARHEWFMTTEQISPDIYYEKYFKNFNPDLFDADSWAQEAKKCGIQYMVFTTKHHEGFALWDSQFTDYKVTNTEFGRDLLAELLPAFRNVGIKIGLYHSLIDWHHPHFTLDGLHPLRSDAEARRTNDSRDMSIYQDYLAGQVTELLTNYGKIDYIWYDFPYSHRDWGWSKGKGAIDWDSQRLEALCLKLQPHILINDRLELGRGITTPEQFQPDKPLEKKGLPVLWEACQTMYGTWGYDRDNQEWKSSEMLLKMLIDTVAKDGNFLMNIGPNPRGELDERAITRMQAIGNWMRLHKKAVIGCRHSDYEAPADCRYTQNGNKLYLHLYSYPYRNLHLKNLAGKVSFIRLLNDGSEIFFRGFDPDEVITSTEATIAPEDIVITLPVLKPNVLVPVIEITLVEEIADKNK